MLSREEQLSIIDSHIHTHERDLFEIDLNVAKLMALGQDTEEYNDKYTKIEKCVHVLLEKKREINAIS